MRQTKDILISLEKSYSNIDYYQLIVEEIEKNVEKNPDISIESCKALTEGISKFIWRQLDSGYDSVKVDKMDFPDIFKKSVATLSLNSDLIETDFVKRASALIQTIGEVRNKRGDISHGKLSPKQILSDAHFSNLIMQMTDGLVYYLLTCFSGIEFQKDLEFEDNPEFNNYLDEENPFGNLRYSKALFDQDIEAYRQELLNYLDTIEAS
ncbi:MAG: hypothetical protein EPO58_15260 [Chitinophagaceae bacterium]|nr:MAG: hypothetical protein EPO58_15260 [Chitinophagaceae bacterium]